MSGHNLPLSTERTTYISAIGGGLGDIIVALPVIRALIKRAKRAETEAKNQPEGARDFAQAFDLEKIVAVMRTPRQMGFEELIPGLSGTIKEVDLVAQELKPNESYINLRGHRLQTDYFWGGPEFERDYPGFQINDILAQMCRDFGIDADFTSVEPFSFSRQPQLKNTIACIPGTTVDTKTWATKNWLNLKQRLEEQGYSVCMLGQPEYSQAVAQLQDQQFPLLQTPTIKDAVDILSSVKAAVSVDTGLMHLAVQQGTPTVSLFQDPIFYRPYPNALKLLSKHCAPVCVRNRMSAKPEKVTEYPEWNWKTCDFNACQVAEEERCINSITVDDVLAGLSALV
jgi:ADP-heptose:LPS heptosyltransferase